MGFFRGRELISFPRLDGFVQVLSSQPALNEVAEKMRPTYSQIYREHDLEENDKRTPAHRNFSLRGSLLGRREVLVSNVLCLLFVCPARAPTPKGRSAKMSLEAKKECKPSMKLGRLKHCDTLNSRSTTQPRSPRLPSFILAGSRFCLWGKA